PRRPLRRGVPDQVLVCLHVVVPVLALSGVVRRELPVLLGFLDAAEEALALLFVRDVQEELADRDAVARQIALEGTDVLEALVPDVLRDQLGRQPLLRQEFRVYTHDQGLLLAAAVEAP